MLPTMNDKICRWFMSASSSERIELLCSLIQLCLPQELWFLGTCIEDRSRKDASQFFIEEEKRSNTVHMYDSMNADEAELFDSLFLKRLITNVSLLNSSNSKCADRLFTFIVKVYTKLVNLGDGMLNEVLNEDLHLLFTLSAFHPAFIFKQRLFLSNILSDFKRIMAQLKYCRLQNGGMEVNLGDELSDHRSGGLLHLASPNEMFNRSSHSLLTVIPPHHPFTDVGPLNCSASMQSNKSGNSPDEGIISRPMSLVHPIASKDVQDQLISLQVENSIPLKYAGIFPRCDKLIRQEGKVTQKTHGSRKLKDKSKRIDGSFGSNSLPKPKPQNNPPSKFRNCQHPSHPPSLDSSCSEDYLTPLGSPDIVSIREDYTNKDAQAGEHLNVARSSDKMKQSKISEESLGIPLSSSMQIGDGRDKLTSKHDIVTQEVIALPPHDILSNEVPSSKVVEQSSQAIDCITEGKQVDSKLAFHEKPYHPPHIIVPHSSLSFTEKLGPGIWNSSESYTCSQCGHHLHPCQSQGSFIPHWNLPFWCTLQQTPRPVTMMVAPISFNHLLSCSAQFYQPQVGYTSLPQKPFCQTSHISSEKLKSQEAAQRAKQNGQMAALPHSLFLVFDQTLKHFTGEHCADPKNTMCSNCGKFGHSPVACLEPNIDSELKTKSCHMSMKDSPKS